MGPIIAPHPEFNSLLIFKHIFKKPSLFSHCGSFLLLINKGELEIKLKIGIKFSLYCLVRATTKPMTLTKSGDSY